MYINAVTELDKIDATKGYYIVYFTEGEEPSASGVIDGSYVSTYIKELKDKQNDPNVYTAERKRYSKYEQGFIKLTEMSPETDFLGAAMDL